MKVARDPLAMLIITLEGPAYDETVWLRDPHLCIAINQHAVVLKDSHATSSI